MKKAVPSILADIKEGETLYTILLHVSRSGMLRTIGVYRIVNNEPRWISRVAASFIGWPFDDKREGVKVRGCGMDMGFHLVSTLSRALFGNDYTVHHRWL